MSLVGLNHNTTNPVFTKEMFLVWMPEFEQFLSTDKGNVYFEEMYEVANEKIFKSVFTSDWKLAMSYCIAHYISIVAENAQVKLGPSLADIAGGDTMEGIVSSSSVGSFHKQVDLSYTLSNTEADKFWNKTKYGAALMSLFRTKFVPTIFVVTNGNINGGRQ